MIPVRSCTGLGPPTLFILNRSLSFTSFALQQQQYKVKLWDQLPGEGGEAKKGLEELLGPLRAKNFKSTNPRATVGHDHFDVAIGTRNRV